MKFDVIISSNPILVNRDVMLGRCRVDVGSMYGRCRVDEGTMWGRCRVDVRSMRGRCGLYVRSIIINEGERLVTPPSLIFYKRGALLSEV